MDVAAAPTQRFIATFAAFWKGRVCRVKANTHTHKHTSALFESDLLSDPLRSANVHYWLMQNFEVPQMAPLVIIHARRSGFATRK